MVKRKRIKQFNVVSDDVVKVRNMLILLVGVVIICVGLYFLTDKMIQSEKQDNKINENVEIDYDIATVGTMFNRVESEYFVLIYSKEENGKDLDAQLDTYRSSDNYVKTYYIDLDLKVNESIKGDKLVEKPLTSKEVSVKEATLYVIKDGKVENCYSGIDNIKEILK